ncbi:Acyl-transf-3 domain-containing protein [Aphelenchoides besseyi]|nr:Acyl-transf-3 domain-containing protein [Aphelenchoides besseyi]
MLNSKIPYVKLTEQIDQSLPLSHSWQTNVQGLRGIAIVGVLLFHLWSKSGYFANGYLGVDVFFVISGYLMQMLLNAKAPLGLKDAVQFYFRRLKRIIPTYLFVILLALVTALWLVSPTDFQDLRSEIYKPLIYTANIPTSKGNDYFAETQGGFTFFVHLWSISTELQFYAFVPFLVFVLHRIALPFQLLLIAVVASVSFYVQLTSTGNFEHMNLIGRIWNFLFGFLAFYLQEFWRRRSEVSNDESVELLNFEKKSVSSRLSDFIRNLLLPSILFIFVVYGATNNRQLNRFLVILLTTLNIAISTDSLILTNVFLVAVGDISYSVYLVHWPIFEYFRYAFVEVDFYSRYASPAAGLFLIFVSLALGQLIEELFKHVGKLMTSWKILLFTSWIFYLAIYGMLHVLKSSELDFTIHSDRLPSNYTKVLADAIRFHETFNEDVKPLSSIDKKMSEIVGINVTTATTVDHTSKQILHFGYICAFALGSVFNLLLIFLILRRSPTKLHPYRPILLIAAFTDGLSILISGLCQLDMRMLDRIVLSVFNGPAKYLPEIWQHVVLSFLLINLNLEALILLLETWFRYQFVKTYTVVREVSAGTFGFTYLFELLILRKSRDLERSATGHFVRLYDSGCTDEFKFMVTQALGETLHDITRKQFRSAFSPSTALRVSIQMLRALADLHQVGFVHRFIRPQAFAVGLGAKIRTVYLADCGLPWMYRDPLNQAIR